MTKILALILGTIALLTMVIPPPAHAQARCLPKQEAMEFIRSRSESAIAFATSTQHGKMMWTASQETWSLWTPVRFVPNDRTKATEEYYCFLDRGAEWHSTLVEEDAQKLSRALSTQGDPKKLIATPRSSGMGGFLAITADVESGEWNIYLIMPFAWEDEDVVRMVLIPIDSGTSWRTTPQSTGENT